jgi:hypothetical protein
MLVRTMRSHHYYQHFKRSRDAEIEDEKQKNENIKRKKYKNIKNKMRANNSQDYSLASIADAIARIMESLKEMLK